MQQALYNTLTTSTIKTAAPMAVRPNLARHLAQRWDLYGVLALMASSAAYALAAFAHLA